MNKFSPIPQNFESNRQKISAKIKHDLSFSSQNLNATLKRTLFDTLWFPTLFYHWYSLYFLRHYQKKNSLKFLKNNFQQAIIECDVLHYFGLYQRSRRAQCTSMLRTRNWTKNSACVVKGNNYHSCFTQYEVTVDVMTNL